MLIYFEIALFVFTDYTFQFRVAVLYGMVLYIFLSIGVMSSSLAFACVITPVRVPQASLSLGSFNFMFDCDDVVVMLKAHFAFELFAITIQL